ncbi:MAG: tetratricopeptide repeat protein [Spirochaetes bacterium]|nr:tetratricopeptide repeat protein [Spirochaetota bacterium]
MSTEELKPDHEITEISKTGYAFLKKGNLTNALETFQKGYELDPKNSYILIGLGDTIRKSKNFTKSIEYYNQALDVDPYNRFALLGIGDAYRGLKDNRNCLKVWMRYMEINPYDYSILTRIADAYKKLHEREEAIKFYEKALAVNGNNKFALMGMGDLYYKEKDYIKTLYYWEKLVSLEPKLINILTMVGNIHRKNKDFEKAISFYKKALTISEYNSYAIFGMADSMRGQGKHEQAAPYWLEMIKMDPENKKVLTRAADCFFMLKDFDRAEELYNDVLRLSYDKFAIYGLSKVYRLKKEYDLAIRNYKGILFQDPKDIRTILFLGDTIEEMDGRDGAIKYFKEKQKEFEGSKEIDNRLSRLLMSTFEEGTEHML